MKALKIAFFLALGATAGQVMAADNSSTAATANTPAESYSYATRLDIKKVIAVTDTSNECGPVPVQMTYEDSRGQQHVIEYQTMGTSCTNG